MSINPITDHQFVMQDLSIKDFDYAAKNVIKTAKEGISNAQLLKQKRELALPTVERFNTITAQTIANQKASLDTASPSQIQHFLKMCKHMVFNLKIHNMATKELLLETNHSSAMTHIQRHIKDLEERLSADQIVSYYTAEYARFSDPEKVECFIGLFLNPHPVEIEVIRRIIEHYIQTDQREIIVEVIERNRAEGSPLMIALFENYYTKAHEDDNSYAELMGLLALMKEIGVVIPIDEFSDFFDRVQQLMKKERDSYKGIIQSMVQNPVFCSAITDVLLARETSNDNDDDDNNKDIHDKTMNVTTWFIRHATNEVFEDWWLNSDQSEELIDLAVSVPEPDRVCYMLKERTSLVSDRLIHRVMDLLCVFNLYDQLSLLVLQYPIEREVTDILLQRAEARKTLQELPAFAVYLQQYDIPRLNRKEFNPTQEVYHEQFKETVVATYIMLSAIKKSQNPLEDIRKMIHLLGLRRRDIALLCGHEPLSNFGAPRTQRYTTPVVEPGPYGYLLDTVKDLAAKGEKVAITLPSGKTHVTTQFMFEEERQKYIWEHTKPPKDKVLSQELMTELCKRVYRALNAGQDPTHTEKKRISEVKNYIAELHWWFANLMPFNRGSASVAEILTTTLWLMNNIVPPKPDPKRPPDCKALCTPNIKIYQAQYIPGKSPR